MRRTQISLDEETYQALKRTAHERDVSMSEVVREVLREQLCKQPRDRRPRSASELSFVSIGDSGQKPGDRFYPISEHHDDALAEGPGRSW